MQRGCRWAGRVGLVWAIVLFARGKASAGVALLLTSAVGLMLAIPFLG